MMRLFLLFCLLMPGVLQADPLQFEVKLLAVDANEGCAIADFDGDGKLDIVAGRQWFHNPDWTPRPVRNFEDVNGYVHSNGDFVVDVNRDGKPDVVAGGFFDTKVYWYENPGAEKLLQGFQWTQHLLVDTGFSQNEASYLHDFNGDGTPEWVSDSWNKNNPLIVWALTIRPESRTKTVRKGNEESTTEYVVEVPTADRVLISEQGQGHGFGIGDINNDGHEDILTGTGWHEAPSEDPLNNAWIYHADWDRHISCPMLVRDINKDGRNDILWGNPHDFGLFVWYAEETSAGEPLKFREVKVDESFSQLHCIHFADIDNDGTDELITGKRVRAHNGNDPGGKEPPVVCYYEIDDKGETFTKHVIVDKTVGIGLQIRTADLDGDDDLDIVVAGKDGTQILFNQLK